MALRNDRAPVAVVDIGSNSVRLIVYDDATRAPAPVYNEKVLCGLGRSIATSGKLEATGMSRALRALRRFRALIEQLHVDRTEVIATAAAREAENGPDFIAQAEQVLGRQVTVLSGTMEAELAAQGVVSGIYAADGFAGDLGGGSLELIDVRGGRLSDALTMPLGGLRLIDASGGNLKKAREIVDEPFVGHGLCVGRREEEKENRYEKPSPGDAHHGCAETADALCACAASRRSINRARLASWGELCWADRATARASCVRPPAPKASARFIWIPGCPGDMSNAS